MFSFLTKSPKNKLKKEHAKLLQEAMLAQRKGDIRTYSELIDKAESVLQKIDELD